MGCDWVNVNRFCDTIFYFKRNYYIYYLVSLLKNFKKSFQSSSKVVTHISWVVKNISNEEVNTNVYSGSPYL